MPEPSKVEYHPGSSTLLKKAVTTTRLTVVTDPRRIKQLQSQAIANNPQTDTLPTSANTIRNTSNTTNTTNTTKTTSSARGTIYSPSPRFGGNISRSFTPSASPLPTKTTLIRPRYSTLDIYGNNAGQIKQAHNPFKIESDDSQATILQKFMHLLSLGPISRQSIIHLMNYDKVVDQLLPTLLDQFLLSHAEIYRSEAPWDNYTYLEETKDGETYILKDKSYKTLIPLSWNYRNEEEKKMVVQNINNALSRLGYPKTHPVRKKILLEKKVEPKENEKEKEKEKEEKVVGLGIGIRSRSTSPQKDSSRSPLSPQSPPPSRLTNGEKKSQKKINKNVSASKIEQEREKVTLKNTRKDNLESVSRLKTSSPAPVPAPTSTSTSTPKPKPTLVPVSTHLHSHSTFNAPSKEKTKMKKPATDGNSNVVTKSSRPATPCSIEKSEISHIPHQQQKHDEKYYRNLAALFKEKYREYSHLYNKLKKTSGKEQSHSENKANLVKLVEMHNLLREWKGRLWDYDRKIREVKKRKIVHY